MQAMANFQQAAAAAMQQAMGQMKGVPGLTQMAATPIGSNPQHAFTDGTFGFASDWIPLLYLAYIVTHVFLAFSSHSHDCHCHATSGCCRRCWTAIDDAK